MKFESKCLHEGYKPQNGEPNTLPICQSTTFRYDTTQYIGELFDMKADGHIYSRISNPTIDAVEKKITALEGGVDSIFLSSGQTAVMFAIMNIASAGDHIVCSQALYGGSINLLGVTLKRFGIETTFVDPDACEEELESAFTDRTRLLFGETLSNPSLQVLDIGKFARVAHAKKVPLIVDNTFATAYLCRPFEHGADIVVYSTSKYMDGHAVQLGGAVVDSGNFDWTVDGKYPELTQPDESYHGVIYTEKFGKKAYIEKARLQLLRDIGATPTPIAAFILNIGLETLPVRMDRHCENALKTAQYLQNHEKIEFVHYPALDGDKYHDLAAKYLPNGCSGVLAVSVKGGREKVAEFVDHLKMITNIVHVADIRTSVLHPASSTHRQLSDEQIRACGITPGMLRLSVGIENIDDIIADIEQALAEI